MIHFNNYVGIDVAKKDFYASFDEQSESRKFNNTAPGINSFLHQLSKLDFQIQNTVIGLESTGSYHLRLCLKCSNVGFRIKIINPLIVKKYNQTKLRRVKNDKKDASLIRYCVAQEAGYEFKETAETLFLKSLFRQRNSLANMLLKNKRQQDDVNYKEDCLKTKFNPVYQEIGFILTKKSRNWNVSLKHSGNPNKSFYKPSPASVPSQLSALLLKSTILGDSNNQNNWSLTLDLILEYINLAPALEAKDTSASAVTRYYGHDSTTPSVSQFFILIYFKGSFKKNVQKVNLTKSLSSPPCIR